ncbi:hypothetical protein [Streptomyces fodineus]|nr:hypothetical protein [Streptomyces fodineus]
MHIDERRHFGNEPRHFGDEPRHFGDQRFTQREPDHPRRRVRETDGWQ